ncbi:MAG: hypothetical protein ACYCWW_15610 [Deltaproteobacteria bacterium]
MRGIPYAVGGALAYSFWGIPRATLDVDLNVFVRDERWEEVFSALDGNAPSAKRRANRALC